MGGTVEAPDPEPGWVSALQYQGNRKDETGTIDAVDVLLEALGIDWRAVATVAVGEGRDLRFIEPVLDAQLPPTTFPETQVRHR